MEKSIESIWKNGFIKEEALIAPRINALYEKKSNNFVDKFIRDFKINLWAILLFTIVPFTLGIVQDVFLLGITACSLLWYTVYFGFKKLKELENLEKTDSSYEYIKQFDLWLQLTINGYVKIYRVLYPMILILSTLGVWETTFKEEVMSSFEPSELLFDLPINGVIMVTIGAALLSIFARKIYELDMKIVYGAQFKKLKDMISEMEELQKEI